MMELADIAGTNILAGRLAGEALAPRLEEAALRNAAHGLLILDFGRVEVITASYFLAATAWSWSSREVMAQDIFVLLANLSPGSLDEVELGLRSSGLKALSGSFLQGKLAQVKPLNLEPSERETYRLVEEMQEVSAADLFKRDPRIQPTAWSNRLVLLHSYRILRRRKAGRQLIYSLPWRCHG